MFKDIRLEIVADVKVHQEDKDYVWNVVILMFHFFCRVHEVCFETENKRVKWYALKLRNLELLDEMDRTVSSSIGASKIKVHFVGSKRD